MKKPLTFLLAAFFVLGVAATTACSGTASGEGETGTVTGLVTKSDLSAKTFSVKGKDGKEYDFKMMSGSKGDINEIKEHQDQRKEIDVKFKTGSSPFTVIYAD